MNEAVQLAGGRSSPGLRYRDVGAAIVWLSTAFGFERRSVVADGAGHVSYAELSFGNTIIMLGAVRGFEIDRYMAQPDDIGGAETQCCYYVVDDIDAHYVRARNAGCEIVIDLKTGAKGERTYTCRDPEGHLWSFGTYDPWEAHVTAAGARHAADSYYSAASAEAGHASATFPRRLAAGVSIAALVTACAALWVYGESWRSSREASAAPAVAVGPEVMISEQFANVLEQRAVKDARRRLSLERTARRAAERASMAAREEAAEERNLRVSAEQAAKELAEKLASMQRARDAAEQASAQHAKDLAEQLASTQRAKTAAQTGGAAEVERALAAERTAKEQAERAADDARVQLAAAQTAKAAAEQAATEARARLAFVSESAKEGSEQAIAGLRKQMLAEQAAREAAERATQEARDSLARERSLKQAAWRTVEQLKRRLAMVGDNPQIVQQVPAPKAAAKRAKAAAARPKKAVAAQSAETVPSPTMTAAEWNMYKGPAF